MENRLSKPFYLILFVFVSILLIISCSLLWPRFLYQEGINNLKSKNYKQAIVFLKRAEQSLPETISRLFAGADHFRIYTAHGQALYQLGIEEWEEDGLSDSVLNVFVAAKTYLNRADEVESQDYRNRYWLALTEQELEKSWKWLYPGENNPYNAYPYYQTVLSLRPSGITVRHAYARYLHYKGLGQDIPELVQYMVEIYPPSYYSLKKEAFYNDELIAYMEQGLNLAITNETLPRYALGVLSDIHMHRGDFDRSIVYYKQLLEFKPSENKPNEYILLGHLYLKNAEFEVASDSFTKALFSTENTENTINRIYNTYKREKLFKEFLNFSVHLQENESVGLNLDKDKDLSLNIDMNAAKCWIDMGHPHLGKARLIKITSTQAHAPAYYLLAVLARKEKNWDQMEVSIQKATRLDPYNSGYYYLLAQALNIQKKYLHAEEAATRAIQNNPRKIYGYFNYRAWIRWNQKKYIPAASDWEEAFSIRPDLSRLPYQIALAYTQEGSFAEALEFIDRAIALDPENQKYKDLQTKIK